jgi:hypothetical protein
MAITRRATAPRYHPLSTTREPAMHRTQIYLQEAVYGQLKLRARAMGLSISELVRRAVDREIPAAPRADAQAFFAQLTPLESFADTDPIAYVDSLRGRSRILREPGDDA